MEQVRCAVNSSYSALGVTIEVRSSRLLRQPWSALYFLYEWRCLYGLTTTGIKNYLTTHPNLS